ISGGPIVITASAPVLASQRVGYYSTFNEVWAQSVARAATTLYYNWCCWPLDQFMVLNPVGGGAVSVTATLPGSATQNFTLQPGQEQTANFTTCCAGPVVITANGPILSSQRAINGQAFNEINATSMANAASTLYLNWFDNASPGMISDAVHLVNPGAA